FAAGVAAVCAWPMEMPAASIAAVSDDIFRITNPLARRYRVGTRRRNRAQPGAADGVADGVGDRLRHRLADGLRPGLADGLRPRGSPGGRGKACYSVSCYQNCHFEWR